MAGEANQPLLKKERSSRLQDAIPSGRSVEAFKFQVGLASRTSFWCLLYALAALLPGVITDPNYLGMVSSGVTFVVFTVYQDLGNTLALASQGFAGTFMACFYAYLMNAMMPGGAGGDHYDPVTAHVMIVFFVFFGLWLNISKNTTMFMLCYHCYFAMEFVNPNSTSIFNTSWAVGWDDYTTTTIVTAVIGLVSAVFVVLFPMPIRATTACRDSARLSTNALTRLMAQLVKYYEQSAPSVDIHRLEVVIEEIRQITGDMSSKLDGAWYEGFFSVQMRCIREQLLRHRNLMLRMSDNLSALQVCIAKESFGQTHVDCMDGIKKEVAAVVITTKQLLEVSCEAASDGDISSDERAGLRLSIAATKDASAELCTAFRALREKMSPGQVICPDLQSEYFFVYCLSVYARYAADYAQEMLQDPPPVQGHWSSFRQSVWSLVDPNIIVYDKNYRSFVLRNTCSILGNFYIGFFILGYSGIASGTCALLISNYAGSAMQKNLGRLQGVVVGNVIPHIIVQMVGTMCHSSVTVLRAIAIFLWEILTNYIYYSSPAYGYIGCLAAAFGASVLVTPCTMFTSAEQEAASQAAFEHGAFEKIHETAIATIVLTFVDSVLAPKRASTMANDALIHMMAFIDSGVQSAFHPRLADGSLQGGAIQSKHAGHVEVVDVQHREPGLILSLINTAATLGEEADKEPRMHRVNFPKKFFDSTIRICHFLRANLSELEHVLKGSDEDYDDVLVDLRRLQSFSAVQSEIVNALDDVMILTMDVLGNETGDSRHDLVKHMLQRASPDGLLKNMPTLIEELNGGKLRTLSEGAAPPATLEDDTLCRICVVLMLLDTIYEHLTDLTKLGITSS